MYDQNDEFFKFELPDSSNSIIKVMGVGGGGSNAVNYMHKKGIKGVDFYVCNTDVQALNKSDVSNKIQIGKQTAKGLGAGTDPEQGRIAAEENADEIKDILQKGGAEMLFITAGMGGGTGTGAAPVIARVAKELDILTIGIVTLPFTYEGPNKRILAETGVNRMKEYCDTVLVILNDNIIKEYGDQPLRDAYYQADAILANAAKSIAEVITNPSDFVNVDFNDFRTALTNGKNSVMGSGVADGPNRIEDAISRAMDSKLLDNNDITGATKLLVSIMTSNSNPITGNEFHKALEIVQTKAGKQADLKYGVTTDDALGDSIRITIVAAGFLLNKDLEKEIEITIPTANFDVPIDSGLVDGTSQNSTIDEVEPSFDIKIEIEPTPKADEPLPFEVENTLIPRKPAIEPEPKEVVSIDGSYLLVTDLTSADNPLKELEQKGTAKTLTLAHIRTEREKRAKEYKATGKLPKSSGHLSQALGNSVQTTETTLQNFPPSGPSLSGSVITGNKFELGKNRFLHDNAD